MIANFKHKTLIQIRFKDVDMMGHVNNANHLTYFELARVHYFDEIVNEPIDWSKQGIILAHMEVDYKMPILLTDKVFVFSRISKFGYSSFTVEYIISKLVDGTYVELATGKSVQVCFNYETNSKLAVPESWKAKVLAYEVEASVTCL